MHFMALRWSKLAEMMKPVAVTCKQVNYKMKLLKHGRAGQ